MPQTRLVTAALALALAQQLRVGAPARLPELLAVHGWWSSGARVPGDADVQVVYLPALLPREAQSGFDRRHEDVPLPYTFDAFGRSFDLQLVPNRRLVSPNFRVWTELGQEVPLSAVDPSCHFLHAGPGAVAAFSACKDHALHGLIVVDNSTYEVRPLRVGEGRSGGADGGAGGRTAHVIRRAPPPPAPRDDARPLRSGARRPRKHSLPIKPGPASYTIEIALFLDESAYKIFHPFFNYNEADLRDMLLAYMNGVQALYQHSSLGTRIQLSLVRLTLLRSQPAALPKDAERARLLDAFCAYQRGLNVEDDDDPQHWDMALLLSGLDFYSTENGRWSGVTMGLAPVGGVCMPAHACVISEFGVTDVLGHPYPSAGFTSVYILAHEIGHNLGMHHDGTGNACPRDGFIMSPSRGTSGEATWSACSRRVVDNLQWATCLLDGGDDLDTPSELQHDRFGLAPGALWGAKKQCEVLLRDVDASPASPAGAGAGAGAGGAGGLCAQLSCRSPHRAGFYYAGPALPGTACGDNMWCQGGECVPSGDSPTSEAPSVPSSDNGPLVPGSGGPGSQGPGSPVGWGPWHWGSCRSGCTAGARGSRDRRRSCPRGASCDGAAYDVALCDDTKVCGKKKRISTNALASRRCAEYSALVPALDARGGGLQAPHDPTRMWMGCAIFCRRASGGGFYAPRVELNDAGLDAYFPDGTWCHHDGSQHYYCLQHHCLPENFKMNTQMNIWELPSEDLDGAFNARARSAADSPAEVSEYLSLDERGQPLRSLALALPPTIPDEPEHNWEVKDYIEIPTES